MTAYPFMQWPTFEELRQRLLDEYGCKYVPLDGTTLNEAAVYCLERTVDGVVKRYGVMYESDERLAPTVVRSICHRLKVDPREFGLTIG